MAARAVGTSLFWRRAAVSLPASCVHAFLSSVLSARLPSCRAACRALAFPSPFGPCRRPYGCVPVRAAPFTLMSVTLTSRPVERFCRSLAFTSFPCSPVTVSCSDDVCRLFLRSGGGVPGLRCRAVRPLAIPVFPCLHPPCAYILRRAQYALVRCPARPPVPSRSVLLGRLGPYRVFRVYWCQRFESVDPSSRHWGYVCHRPLGVSMALHCAQVPFVSPSRVLLVLEAINGPIQYSASNASPVTFR